MIFLLALFLLSNPLRAELATSPAAPAPVEEATAKKPHQKTSLKKTVRKKTETVLIFHFGTWGGVQFHNGKIIADFLKVRPLPFYVETCLIPSVYDESAAAARACVDQLLKEKRKVVMSVLFSQGGRDVSLFGMTGNWDSFHDSDAKGVRRTGQKILKNGLESQQFNMPIEKIYCSLGPFYKDLSGRDIKIDGRTDTYLTNNAAYLLVIEMNSLNLPFVLIGVPGSVDSGRITDPDDEAVKKVLKVIHAALYHKKAEKNFRSGGFEELRKHLTTGKLNECEKDAIKKISEDYLESLRKMRVPN